MSSRLSSLRIALGLLPLVLAAQVSTGQEPTPPTKNLDAPVEVQPRGPLHEAYAHPLEAQPAPDDNASYIPGSWVYRDTRWLWRPGYWTSFQLGRVWNPAHYLWTPGGYVFVDGYWDYPLEDRGLIFAPVVFRQPLYLDPGY